jgi:hypothetical protein
MELLLMHNSINNITNSNNGLVLTSKTQRECNSRESWGVEVYPCDSKIVRTMLNGQSKPPRNTRTNIVALTRKSLNNMLFKVRNKQKQTPVFLTLTYPGTEEENLIPTDGKIVKQHINAFNQFLRRNGVEYFWFLEFQERGAPHMHYFLTLPIKRERIVKAWCSIVGSKGKDHREAGIRIEWFRSENKEAAYAAKYASKKEQKEVPENYKNVGRFWGISQSLQPKAKIEIYQSLEKAKLAIRVLRKLYLARCKNIFNKHDFKDNGKTSKILWSGGYDKNLWSMT